MNKPTLPPVDGLAHTEDLTYGWTCLIGKNNQASSTPERAVSIGPRNSRALPGTRLFSAGDGGLSNLTLLGFSCRFPGHVIEFRQPGGFHELLPVIAEQRLLLSVLSQLCNLLGVQCRRNSP